MPSLVTSIIGGIQGASAAHDAAAAQQQGYKNAANTVNTAVGNADPYISNAAATAGGEVSNAAAAAAGQATGAAQTAGAGVTGAAGTANSYLNPFVTNGSTASNNLNNLQLASQFSFNPSDLANTPGYQFQLQQGTQGIEQNAAAAGLLGSGGTLKALDQYGQGLASTTYNQQYQNALAGYQANLQGLNTNANVLLPQASMGLTAGNLSGSNLVNAAQYSGNAGINAAQYSGNTGMTGAEYSGNTGIAAADQIASNLINAGVYTGNTQIGAGNAIAQGDVGAANQWNSMLGGIGSTLNSVATMGFGAGGGWNFGNIGTNFANLNGAANYGGGGTVGTPWGPGSATVGTPSLVPNQG